MAFYSYLSTKIIIAFITKSYQDLFGVRSYINAKRINNQKKKTICQNADAREYDENTQTVSFKTGHPHTPALSF